MEKYDDQYLLNDASEEAMKNMIELLKMRKKSKQVSISQKNELNNFQNINNFLKTLHI